MSALPHMDRTELACAVCEQCWQGFGWEATGLIYGHRLNGPAGLAGLASLEEIAGGLVGAEAVTFGYGSGIENVGLENGHLLFALCDAWEGTGDAAFAAMARRVFAGMRRIATVSPVRGFVPRGPHPDGKSYYRDSSQDQHMAFMHGVRRFVATLLASEADREFAVGSLGSVLERVKEAGWVIQNESGAGTAHVGHSWLGMRPVQVTVLLSCLAAAASLDRDSRWGVLYKQFANENDGKRLAILQADQAILWPPYTLFSNQSTVGLAALAATCGDAELCAQLKNYVAALARRALESDVFDERAWRRLDWATSPAYSRNPRHPERRFWSHDEVEEALRPFGLSQQKPATVFDLCRAFQPELWGTDDLKQNSVNDMLCFGLPTVAFHMALLSEDEELVRQVSPYVSGLVEQVARYGHLYQRGETFHRGTVLALHLAAVGAGFTRHCQGRV